MDKPFVCLLDAPASPVARIQIAKLGEYKDPRYGEFSITRDEAEEWQKNLAALPGGRALIDEDHLSDKPSPHRRTEASGWITNVELEGERVMGDVQWTPKGEAAIEEERYLFFSPAFGEYRNEQGEAFEHTLTGGALTNKPFLTQMPMVTLASAPRLLEAARQAEESAPITLDQLYESGVKTLDISQDQREKHAVVTKEINGKKVHMFPIPPGDKKHARAALSLLPRAISAGHINEQEAAEIRKRANAVLGKKEMSDSRGQMRLTPDTLTALGVTDEAAQKKILEAADAEDADFAQVFAMVEAAQPGAPTKTPEGKTLEEQAAAAGKVVLDAGQVTQLMAEGKKPAPQSLVTDEALIALGVKDEDERKKLLSMSAEGQEDIKVLAAAKKAVDDEDEDDEPGAGSKTLEQQALDEGKVLLDATQLNQLTLDAKAGREARDELRKSRFDTAFEKAEQSGKAVPAQRDQYESFYDLDAEGTLKMLEAAPAVLNTKPQGRNVPAPSENTPDGVHPEAYELEQQVRSWMQEHSETNYLKALEAVTGVTVEA